MNPEIESLLTASRENEKAGNYAEALRLAQQALELSRAAQDGEGMCGGLANMAYVHFRTGHYAESQQLAGEALAQAAHIHHSATALLVLGLCAMETDDPATAETHFQSAAEVSRAIGYPLGVSLSQHNLTLVYSMRGKFALALAAADESYRMNLQIGYPNYFGPQTRAAIYQITNERTRAKQALEELAEWARPGTMTESAYCYLAALVALDEEDLEQALPLLQRSRQVATLLGMPLLKTYARLATSRAARMEGDLPAARDWIDEAITLCSRTGMRYLQGEALLERALVMWDMGEVTAVEHDLRAAIEAFSLLGAAYGLAHATFLLAALALQLERPEAAELWLDAAQKISRGGYGFIVERHRALSFPPIAEYLRSDRAELKTAAETLLKSLERVMPSPLRIHGLGRFEVWQHRRLIPGQAWMRRKAGELFRFLLLQPKRVALKDTVLEALWPGHAPDSAQALFHHATSAVRRILEPGLPERFPSRYLSLEAERVELRLPEGSTVDFEDFEAAIQRALQAPAGSAAERADLLKQALALYVETMFPLDVYSDWTAPTRERLAELYLRGLLRLAETCLEMDQPRAALEACQLILARDPWREDAVLAAMRACLALRDRPAAIRLYRTLETSLREDLKLTPREDLQALARSLHD